MSAPSRVRLDARRLAAEHLYEQVREGRDEAWRGDHDAAMFARDVEDWAAVFVEEAALVGALARNLHRLTRDNRLPHVEEIGEGLAGLLDAFDRFGGAVGDLVREAERLGHAVARETEFRAAHASIRHEIDRVKRSWPRRDPARIEAALQEVKAGRYQDVGDVIGELQSGTDSR